MEALPKGLSDVPFNGNIPGMVRKEECQYLFWIAHKMRNREGVIAEVGSWLGRSAWHLAKGADRTIHCFDDFKWRRGFSDKCDVNLPEGACFQHIFDANVKETKVVSHKVAISDLTGKLGDINILHVDSAKRTPELVDGCKAVLEQRGDGGTGFSRGWKMALWARLYDSERAYRIFKGYIKEQAYMQLFSKCFTPLQVDGTFGVTAGITEMLMQSHEGIIDLLPALPQAWSQGQFDGVCARGAFELDMQWMNGQISRVDLLSKKGQTCRINPRTRVKVTTRGQRVMTKTFKDGSIEFDTQVGQRYTLIRSGH
jgi:hypothetical protein